MPGIVATAALATLAATPAAQALEDTACRSRTLVEVGRDSGDSRFPTYGLDELTYVSAISLYDTAGGDWVQSAIVTPSFDESRPADARYLWSGYGFFVDFIHFDLRPLSGGPPRGERRLTVHFEEVPDETADPLRRGFRLHDALSGCRFRADDDTILAEVEGNVEVDAESGSISMSCLLPTTDALRTAMHGTGTLRAELLTHAENPYCIWVPGARCEPEESVLWTGRYLAPHPAAIGQALRSIHDDVLARRQADTCTPLRG